MAQARAEGVQGKLKTREALTPTIRPPVADDAAAIADLLGELGYPATREEVLVRLEHVSAYPHAIVLVAELDGRVVGVATGHAFPSIHVTSIVAWLSTLVVSATHHGRGVGRGLSGAVESWARDLGAVRISVSSGLHRAEAHAFYEHLGYDRSGLRLTKPLTSR
jgi:GNAT superfamily N-acetyltransferase